VPGLPTTKQCRNFDKHQMTPLLGDATSAGPASNHPFVCMLENDEANYDACKLMQKLYGTRRFIVQQNDPKWKQKFNDLGGLVLDPDAIVVEPLQQFLGSAQAAPLLLHFDPKCEVVRVFVDQQTAGLSIAQCGLPKNVQVLEVRRHKSAVVPRAYTKVQYDDELMLCGHPSSLSDVTAIKKGRIVLLQGRSARGRVGLPGGPSGRVDLSGKTRLFNVNGAVDETTVLFQVSAFEDEANAEMVDGGRMSSGTTKRGRTGCMLGHIWPA